MICYELIQCFTGEKARQCQHKEEAVKVSSSHSRLHWELGG